VRKVFLVLFFQKKNCLPYCRLTAFFLNPQINKVLIAVQYLSEKARMPPQGGTVFASFSAKKDFTFLLSARGTGGTVRERFIQNFTISPGERFL
jgi:hypothetical protein